ncbi:MAG TPA: GNAT family protein [Bacteroidales bacterium]|nr:GNAT family protein [Bacteroidales bacterium]HQN14716.1 GNAT family protein [Bacteroidales bacterium]HQP14410.1 GNAT family protein [Bacteroidales bacterium]
MQNPSIRLRAVEPEDIDFIYRLENDTENMDTSENTELVSRYAIEQYVLGIGRGLFETGQLRMIIEAGDAVGKRPVGCIDLFEADPINRRAGIGIYITAGEQKKGYASAALGMMIEYCFGKLSLHQLFCNIGQENTASMKLFEKHGFKVVGLKKDWRYHNKIWKHEYLLQLINS